MGVIFYNIFLLLFRLGTHLLSPFQPKAAKWVRGRKNIFKRMEEVIVPGAPIVWMHCASLGEFEQGRTLLEAIRAQYPGYRILLTFFSPSGYEIQKNYKGADWIFYLPMDSPANARRFLDIVNPSLVLFVKYEFWYYYLKKIKYRNIPVLLVSALFRRDMSFFKWYGGLQRHMLGRFDRLFVQNESSGKLVDELGYGPICSISGDTRFDRVTAIADRFTAIPEINDFKGNATLVVAGSTWPEDEKWLADVLSKLPDRFRLLVAPHELGEKHLEQVDQLFPGSVRYSALSKNEFREARVLIIDNVGMLSRLFYYADIAWIGGGFRSMGVHNVLEPAVFSKPVFFGPYYKKYQEAIGLVQSCGADSVEETDEEKQRILMLWQEDQKLQEMGKRAGAYVLSHKGATGMIMDYIQEKRLLTR